MTFVVGTWNVQWQFGEWQERQPAILDVLQHLDGDVIMLQECWREQAGRLADTLGCYHTWAGHDRAEKPERSMGNAILSRWPIQTEAHHFLPDEQGREYRTIMSARLNTPFGILPAFTTHLDHRYDHSATRVSQLAVASDFISEHDSGDLPPILAGDFNAVPDSDEVRKLTGRSTPYVQGRVWSDAWEQVGDGDGLTWSSANPYLGKAAWPNRRLDYVLIGWPREQRPIGNPVRAWLFGTGPVDGIIASDHYGVAVEIHT